MGPRSLIVAGAVVGLALPATAAADTGTNGNLRLRLDVGVKPAKPGTAAKPRSVSLSYEQELTTTTGARPERDVKRITITLARGFRFNFDALPQCKVSAIVKAESFSVCPRRSKVGIGTATADARPTLPDLIPAKVRAYSGVSDLDLRDQPQDPVPALIVSASAKVGGVTVRGFFVAELRGRRLVLDFPAGSGGGAQSLYIIRELGLTLRNRKGADGTPFLQAPKTCTGRWRFTQTTTFRGGASVSARDNVPCKRSSASP